jgi:predicted NodU family carbamoyl transferase
MHSVAAISSSSDYRCNIWRMGVLSAPNDMKILSYNPGHDGAIAYLEDSRLFFSLESEKDSNYRYSGVSVTDVLDAVSLLGDVPDVICMGGWWPLHHHEYLYGSHRNSGYRGLSPEQSIIDRGRLLQGKADYFSSTHERSHIMCAFGMSPLPMGTPCYALVWEGEMGTFYELDSKLNVTLVKDVLLQPGNRFSLLYGLADPTFPKDGPYPRNSDAGKLMALASFSKRSIPTAAEERLLRFLLDGPYQKLSDYSDLSRAPHLNVGLEDPEFRNFAGLYSDAMFDIFYKCAKTTLDKNQPLVISGGCGLNCDWNTKWKESGIFSEVFVPPVANDSGAAIGTAIDAQFHYTGNAKIEWSVYSGLGFRAHSAVAWDSYDIYEKDLNKIADMLACDLVLGWVDGKYEIGPRALGNRSILAAPFRESTRVRLNEIKQREQFRPIAPVCLADDAKEWFGCDGESPFMLYTYKVSTKAFSAVTHVNGTARLQTVSCETNRTLYDLLVAFKERTGYGVLCNTSLNYHGKGCINNITDLSAYAIERGLDGFVVAGRAYLLKESRQYQKYINSAEARCASAPPH